MGRAHRNGGLSAFRSRCKAPRGSKGDHFLTESGPPPVWSVVPVRGLIIETLFFFFMAALPPSMAATGAVRQVAVGAWRSYGGCGSMRKRKGGQHYRRGRDDDSSHEHKIKLEIRGSTLVNLHNPVHY